MHASSIQAQACRSDGLLSFQPAMTTLGKPLFLCPRCRKPLPVRPPCSCGFILREKDGIINLMTDEQASEIQPFIEAYDRVRADEQWGDDDLDLPFHPLRHRNIWNIRSRTFRSFQTAITGLPRGVALDIGAGNCWMTRYLDSWGFDAIAVDINTSARDGLRAGQKFIDQGARFLRVRTPMERLPFVSSGITLIATNASFHYASDFRVALSEFERVLTPGGMVVILDTPFYENAADGERAVMDRISEFQRKYSIPQPLAGRARFLTFRQFEEMMQGLKWKWRLQPVWPGVRRKYEEFIGALLGRRVARFPIVVMERE